MTELDPSIRLSVNLAPDSARILKAQADRQSITVTEAIRRAIAVWDYVTTEQAKGHRLAMIETRRCRERVREFTLWDGPA